LSPVFIVRIVVQLNIYYLQEKWSDENVIRKVIVPAAGLGTRLFPATKVQSKEMLPTFSHTATGGVAVKPIVQVVFEQLYDAGLREFCCVADGESVPLETILLLISILSEVWKGWVRMARLRSYKIFIRSFGVQPSCGSISLNPKDLGMRYCWLNPFVQKRAILLI
jgi:hypothetical protein